MKNILLSITLLLGVLTASAQRQTIAVEPAKASAALLADLSRDTRQIQAARIAEALDRHLIVAITASRKFMIVGRQDLKAVLSEQDLGASGNVNPDTAAAVGELKGAKYKLVVVLDHFQEESARATFDGADKLKRRFQASAQATIYDTSTGEVLDASNIQIEKTDVIDVDPGSSTRTGGRTDELIPLITRELAEKTASRLLDVTFPSKIVNVDGTTLTLNRGEGFFAVNDAIVIFDVPKVVTDPDTGEKIKIKGKPIGAARIVSVDVSTAQAQAGDDAKPVVGAVVSKYQQ